MSELCLLQQYEIGNDCKAMTAPTPTFPYRIERGKFTLDDERRFRAWVKRQKDGRGEMVLRRAKSKRSLAQNRTLWMWLTLLADELGYEPQDRERLHYDLLAVRFGMEERLSGLVLPSRTSSELSTKEMADYLDWFQRHAAVEFGVSLPSPNEVDLDAYAEASA